MTQNPENQDVRGNLFELRRFIGEGCAHQLLIRVPLPNSSNTSHTEDDEARGWADDQIERVSREFETESLPQVCAAKHSVEQIGRMELLPFGDELYTETDGTDLMIGYCRTDYGDPWIILGVADTPDDFWKKLGHPDNQDLRDCLPVPPAHVAKATFVTDDATPPARTGARGIWSFLDGIWRRLRD